MYYVSQVRRNRIEKIFKSKSDSACLSIASTMAIEIGGKPLDDKEKQHLLTSGIFEIGDTTLCFGEIKNWA